MKEAIINAAGKTWQFLGQNGETDVASLSKRLKESDDIVFQSLGWLAREDKIAYTKRSSKTFVSLADSETQIFKMIVNNRRQTAKENTKPKKRAKSA